MIKCYKMYEALINPQLKSWTIIFCLLLRSCAGSLHLIQKGPGIRTQQAVVHHVSAVVLQDFVE